MMQRQETPLTFEQATIRPSRMSDMRKDCAAFLRKPLANPRNATNFFLGLGKACRYFFAFFVPSSHASFARQLIRFLRSSPLSFTSRVLLTSFLIPFRCWVCNIGCES